MHVVRSKLPVHVVLADQVIDVSVMPHPSRSCLELRRGISSGAVQPRDRALQPDPVHLVPDHEDAVHGVDLPGTVARLAVGSVLAVAPK